ncbi:MAG TPA: gliding motility-associated C-terminal domain-containing protein [Bacteroidales bacterium]
MEDISYFGSSFQIQKHLKKYLIIICFVFFNLGMYSQIAPPEMISVSVRPLTDTVTIDWNPSPTPGVLGYVINEYWKKLGNWSYDSIRTENGSAAKRSTFSYPKVRKGPVMFYVAAYTINANGLKYSDKGSVDFHKTIFTQLHYDSCALTTTVTWTKYYGWGSKFGFYRIFQITGGGIQMVKDNISANDTTAVIPVNPNQNYTFYVWATTSDLTVTSTSNDSTVYTKSVIPPSYINADYATFNPNSSNPVKIKFNLDPNSQITSYQLYVSDNPNSTFTPVNSPILSTSDSIVIQDNVSNSAPKYYRLDALNSCNKSIYRSNIATAIILTGSVQSGQMNLAWNEYLGWDNGVAQYNVYRVIGTGSAQLIGVTTTNNFNDNVKQLMGQQLSGNICYYIEAVSNPDNQGNINQSLSSNYCIDLSEAVFIPNAFTPNGDGLNDEFKPSFAFMPTSFVLIVYNRYGFKVFETTDPLKGWDGTLGNGKKANEGAYVYFIKFSSETGKTVEKKGSFSLIYP